MSGKEERQHNHFGALRAIWGLSEGQRLRYFGAMLALVVASCFLHVVPLIPQTIIDGVIVPGVDELPALNRWLLRLMGGPDSLGSRLWLPAALLAGITAIAGLFTYLRGRWSAGASEGVVRKARDRVYNHLQHLPASFFDKAATGDLVQRCTSDVETLRVFLASHVVEIGRAMVMLIIPIPLMLAVDVRMTIASLVLIPAIVVFAVVFFSKIKAAFKKTDEAEGALTSTIQENLTGIRVVRAFARQDHEAAKMDTRNQAHRELDFRLYGLMAWYWSVSDFLCFSQMGIMVGVGGWLLGTGELTVGAFFYFMAAVNMFLWPVRMMGRILTDLGKATVAMGRLHEILAEPQEGTIVVRDGIAQPAVRTDVQLLVPRLSGRLEFQNVCFSHGEESPVLHEVSFKIEAGQTLAILGPSGCGKSTIVNLLLRLYEYDSGEILVDRFRLRDLQRQSLRSNVAVVMQEPFLYSKTLRENITIGRSGAGEEEMIEATTIASVHESILSFDQQYDTVVGERGVTLSGGQRQRVALSRALLQDPAFLVLDDALSAVDTETEALILDALRQRRGKHTTILIAHRLSTLMHADQIIVLDHGRIVQSGSHDELVQQDGMYQRLWAIQASPEEGIEPRQRSLVDVL